MSELYVNRNKDVLNQNNVSFEERLNQLEKEDRRRAEAEKRDKQSPYKNWYQFNLDHNKDMMWLAKNAPKAHLILLFLLEQMDSYNAVVCSYQVICEALDMGRTTASQAIKLLKEKGFVAVLKSGTSNVYVVNDDLAWKSWGKNKKYSKFPANVILAASENTEHIPITTDKLKTLSLKQETKEEAN